MKGKMSFVSQVYLIINVVMYFITILLLIISPEYLKFIIAIFSISLIISTALIIKYRKMLLSFAKTFFFRQVITNIIRVFLVACILGMVNFLVIKNDYFLDFTHNKLHTLSDQSINTVKLLQNKPLKMKMFAKRNAWGRYLKLLRLYKKQSTQIELEFLDVDKELALVNLYNIKNSGTLIIDYEKQSFRTQAKDELAVTNLLLRILNPTKKVLYYSVGHNEMSFEDENNIGAHFLKNKILNSNFLLKRLELQYPIPSDAAGVLVLNPQIEFLKSEINNLKNYLITGGALLTTLSPSFNGILINHYTDFLTTLGLKFHNVLILDRLASQQGSQASIPVVNSYNTKHTITKKLSDRTLFPVSGAIEILATKKFAWSALAKSTPFPASWGEVSFEEVKTGKAQYNEGVDLKGPLNIVIAGENKKSRIIAFSSSNFISNQFQGQTNNFNLFLNSLSWMTKEESLMTLNRPQLEGNLVYLSSIQLNSIFYFTILIFPFFFFGIGIYQYRKKISG